MKQMWLSLVAFIKSLTMIDVVFLAAIVLLIILVVSMIYIIRLNLEEGEDIENNDDDTLDLVRLTKEIEQGSMTNSVDLSKYEEEEEERAIISYDELIRNHNTVKINYKEENNIGDVEIKEIDLNHLTSSSNEASADTKVTMFTYEKEEAFLETLKKMQQMLS